MTKRFHNWTVSMLEDLSRRQQDGHSLDTLVKYAGIVYSFESTESAMKTALLRFEKKMYQIVDVASGKIKLVNKHPKERDSRYGGLPVEAVEHLRKARLSALNAVTIYNQPALDDEHFKSFSYIILMIIAWTSLLHAKFYKDGKTPIEPTEERGFPLYWDLRACLNRQVPPLKEPVIKNLEMLIEIRNVIEHRNLPALDAELFGECQACLINFEAYLVEHFNPRLALNARLNFALQFGSEIHATQIEALRAQQRFRAEDVITLVQERRKSFGPEIIGNEKFRINIDLHPAVGRKGVPTYFEHAETFEAKNGDVEETLVVIERDKHVPVKNMGNFKATQVCNEVRNALGIKFSPGWHHVQCWRYYEVRPSNGSSNPQKTKQQYCLWDQPHKDYVYTKAWVRKLISDLKKDDIWEKIFPNKSKQQLENH